MMTKLYDYLELQLPNPFPLYTRDRLQEENLLGDSPVIWEQIFLRQTREKSNKRHNRKIKVDSTTLVIDNDGKDIPIRKPKVTPKNAVAMIFIPSFDLLLIELKKQDQKFE